MEASVKFRHVILVSFLFAALAIQGCGSNVERNPSVVKSDDKVQSQPAESPVALIDRMIEFIRQASDGERSFQKQFSSLRALIADFDRLYPQDKEVQLTLPDAVRMLGMAAAGHGMENESEQLRQEYIAKAKTLVDRYPQEARAHAILGDALSFSDDADEISVLKAYAQCLRLDKSSEGCRRQYQTVFEDYQQPRCAASNVNPHLAVYGARTEAHKGYSKKVTVRNQTYYLAEKPVLEARDIQKIVFNQYELGDLIQLSPIGAEKMGKFSAQNLGHPMAITLGDQALSVPVIRNVVDGGSIVLYPPQLPKDLCLKLEVPEIPPEAKIQ